LKCPNCQAENPDDSKFCLRCGTKLVEDAILICSDCGAELPADASFCNKCGHSLIESTTTKPSESARTASEEPTSFLNDRYQVKKKLGEGGKKKVYLVHDKKLDRDVAFALIKTENLDEDGRKRVTREAQAMGKLGDNPHIVSIFDTGEINGQPYIIIPVMGGGDVEALIEKASDHKLPLDRTISIAKAVCEGLDFAHSKGVIHRDLKPGNVWLTEDGTAKIGDFGLAVMTDVSRLTMEGIMVGTVSYMPPEQAMPGEVTSKADLYSLGAMLYEMVTGRPPFIGDDNISIIGQHINMQPISPTWHRADLPPALESLIMLLLEKDPEKRPASAKDVLATLESIEKGDIKEARVEQQIPTENPIYRRIFVGRENELKTLQNAFISAMSGQGSLTMVVGEPGIGKTSVCEQLTTFATLRGGTILWGHCYEEGSLSLPYLAFVEAIRSYVMDREPEDLKKDLGSGATDVARIVSEVREKLHVEPRESQSPEEDRYRLMQAVTSFLINAASVKPMLVVLEDLHDADKGTLEMLSYVSRNITGTRVMIIGTYRDVEVNRNHPLSAALAELRRISSFSRVLLRGLSIDEVRRMLAGITHEEIPVGLAEAVHRQTEGNPLFVQEVVRYLTEEKLLVRSGGKLVTSDSATLQMNIPEGLRDVVGKRLSNLGEECNRIMSIAAVIGREFRLDVLRKIADISEDDLLTSIEEAKNIAIIEERSTVGATVTYRFAHAFFRTILYEENIAPRRIRLHQQVARVLEEVYRSRLHEHAAELAEHFSYSSEASDLTKAVEYGEMAAGRASDVFDYGEAARLLQQALKVQEVLDNNDKAKRCDLLTALGRALLGALEVQHAIDVEFPQALALADEIGDKKRAAMICVWACLAVGIKGLASRGSREMMEWAEKADRYAESGTIERGWADYQLGNVKGVWGNQAEALPLLRSAMELARKFGDRELLIGAGRAWIVVGVTPWSDVKEVLQVAENVATAKNDSSALWFAFNMFLIGGSREKADEVGRAIMQLAENTGYVRHIESSHQVEYALAFLDGRLEETVELMERDIAWRQEVGLPVKFEVGFGFALNTLHFLYGIRDAPDNILRKAVLEDWDAPQYRDSPRLPARLGQVDEANQRLDKMVKERPNITSADDMTVAWLDVHHLEAAVLVKHHQSAELLLHRFAGNNLAIGYVDIIARHLGAAAVLLERFDEAKEHYRESIRVCTEMRYRPELALSRLGLTELLLDHYPDEKAEALEHLDFAIKEFREMKMQPSLERALRRKDILKA